MSAPIKLSDFIALSKKYETSCATIQKLETAQQELKQRLAKLEASHRSANQMNDRLMRENGALKQELRELKQPRRSA
jgi:FtsZ-binding cell division protein ZapB